MADWLSKLASEREAAKAAAEAETARKQSYTSHVEQTGRRSYESNKERIERIYTALNNHARRASDMGFKVTTQRDERNGFVVKGQYSYWDGEGYSTGGANLELSPWQNGFNVHYNGRISPTRKSFVALWRVNDKMIAKWVRWSVGEGPDDVVEDWWFRTIFIGCGVAILLVVVGAILLAVISTLSASP